MDRLRRCLVQAWWAPIAVLLAVIEVVFGIVVIPGDPKSFLLVYGTFFILSGVVVVAGLVLRLERVHLGSALVLVGTIPGLLTPPMIAVWIGVLMSWKKGARPVH